MAEVFDAATLAARDPVSLLLCAGLDARVRAGWIDTTAGSISPTVPRVGGSEMSGSPLGAPSHHGSRPSPDRASGPRLRDEGPATRTRRCVLIVDDDADTREMYAWCMLAAGWLVTHAANGEDAVLVATAVQPHAIVMDLRLPVLGGFESHRTPEDGRAHEGHSRNRVHGRRPTVGRARGMEPRLRRLPGEALPARGSAGPLGGTGPRFRLRAVTHCPMRQCASR
ncbi:MAG: response regulator transcription factor [Polyangiaceae bacterium]